MKMKRLRSFCDSWRRTIDIEDTKVETEEFKSDSSNDLKLCVGVDTGGSRCLNRGGPFGEREARAYNRSLGALPPVGSRGKAPG